MKSLVTTTIMMFVFSACTSQTENDSNNDQDNAEDSETSEIQPIDENYPHPLKDSSGDLVGWINSEQKNGGDRTNAKVLLHSEQIVINLNLDTGRLAETAICFFSEANCSGSICYSLGLPTYFENSGIPYAVTETSEFFIDVSKRKADGSCDASPENNGFSYAKSEVLVFEGFEYPFNSLMVDE